MINANAHNPAGLLLLAINHFAQEAIVVVIDRHKRGVSERLVEPDSGPAFAYVSDLTVKNLASCSQYAHPGGLIEWVALILSLFRFSIKNDRRIRDHGLQEHDIYSAFRARIIRDRNPST